jgi:S-adenosylmethionine hydrolase
LAGETIDGLSRTYADRSPGERVALVGSGGFLEIAVVNGSAMQTLAASVGQRVSLERVTDARFD